MREMKDSGIDWIGEIPAHWEVKRLKDIANFYTGNSLNESEKEIYGENMNPNSLPYIGTKDVERNKSRINYNSGYSIPNDNTSFAIAPKGATLICVEGGSAGKKIGFLEQDVCFVNKLCCAKSLINNDKFVYYYFNTNLFVNQFNRLLQGMIGGVSINKIKCMLFFVPPIEEQQAIADYLDEKTAEIDEQISLLEQKQNAYTKLKQSLISQVVTRGLNPKAPLKNSGIVWIGEIPAHWEVRRFKELFRNYTTGFTPDSKDMSNFSDDENKTWVTIGDLSSRFITQSNMCISEKAIQKHLPVITPKDSLLLSFKLSIGKTAFAGKDLYTNEAIVSIPPQRRIDLKYYFYHLPDVCLNNATENIYGAKMLNQKLIANMIMLFPPIEEQQAIADYLDEKTAEIDEQISNIDKKINTYKRLKQSLIDEVVTGKRKI